MMVTKPRVKRKGKRVKGEKTIGRGRGGHLTWSSPPLFMVNYYCSSKVKGKWGKRQKRVENRTPEHVPRCRVSARVRRVPVPFPPGTKSMWGLAEVHWTFSHYSTVSDTPILREWSDANSESTPNLWPILPLLGHIWYSLHSGIFFQSPLGHLGDWVSRMIL